MGVEDDRARAWPGRDAQRVGAILRGAARAMSPLHEVPVRGHGRGPLLLLLAAPVALAAAELMIVDEPAVESALDLSTTLVASLSMLLVTWLNVPLVVALRRPILAWWLTYATAAAHALAAAVSGRADLWPWSPAGGIAYLGVLAVAALRRPRPALVAMWLLTLLLVVGGSLTFPVRRADQVFVVVLAAVALALGDSVRVRNAAQARLAELERVNQRERAHRMLLEERARIARELHDVVAHHMSVISVQAASAPYRISDPSHAAEEFSAIARQARESLGEMRRLLEVLRSEESGGERSPQPGLSRLHELGEAAERAGLPVQVEVAESVPAGGGLTDTVELTAFRVVQEALSNVIRHAPGAATRVSVVRDADGLHIEVVNAAPVGSAGEGVLVRDSGSGHGLVGMRERIALLSGDLEAGHRPGGGYRVAVRLPLAAPQAPADPAVLTDPPADEHGGGTP
jgi:signal transduction histidine kinase